MKEILCGNKKILLDDLDYKYLSNFKWKVIKKGKDWYAVIKKMKGIGRRTTQIYLHEFLIELDNQDCIGFKNKNTLDNRRENLFGVSKGYNIARTRKRLTTKGGLKPKSKYKGVTRRIKKGKTTWEVRISKDKKTYYVGSYKTEKQAGLAYNKKAEELYGEFAYKNIIN
jgi:hypothetical protein